MKTKRFAKLAVLVLTAALLIGAVVGISISADGEPTVAVAGKNISYEGALQVVYYIDVQNLADGQTLKMDFWLGEQGETPSYTKIFAGEDYKVEKDGKIYYSIFSNGVEPIYMTRPIIAQAYVVDAEGAELTRGEAVTYSVYDYAMNRFSQSPTSDQIALYTAFLDYGAAVQTIFGQAIAEEYGWADAYYNITENVYVDGVLDADASVSGAKRPSELESEGKLVDGNYVLAYAGERLGNAFYKGIKDYKYETKYDTYASVGAHTYNIYYTTEGTLKDFEGMTDVNPLFEGGSYTRWSESTMVHYTSGSAADGINNVATDDLYMFFENGTGKDGAASTYIVTGANNSKGAGWKIDINDGTNLAPTVGVTYVVDFDFKINTLDYTGAYDTLVYFGINSTTNNYNTNDGNSNHNFIPFRLYGNGSVDPTIQNFNNQASLAFNKGEWVDFRVEYEVISADRAILRYYLNGVFCHTEATTTLATPESFYVEMRSVSASQQYAIDNLYFATYKPENVKGTGKYSAGLLSTDYNVSYNFDDVSDISSLISKYSGTTLNNVNANHYTAVVDGEFVTGTSDVVADSSVGAGSCGWFAMKGPDNSNNDGEVGTKYIMEMDFKYNGGTGRTDTQRLAYSFGMNSVAQPASSGTSFAQYTLYDDGNGNLNFGSATAPAFQLNKGIWYNILFEYTVDHVGYKVSSTTVWQGTLNVYVNGELVATKATSSQTAGVNMAFESFYFEHNGVDSEYVMDNVYMGIVNDSQNKGTGTYYNKVQNNEILGATVLDFDKDASITSTHVTSGALNFNNYVPYPGTGTQYTDRHVVLTGAGAMKIGTDSQWADGTINGGNVALEVGDVGVFEMDFMWNGSDTPTGYPGDFKLVNASGSTIANLNLVVAAPNDGSAVKLGDYSPIFYEGEWHNILVTVERTESGATVTYYADGVQFHQATTTTDCSVLKGIAITVRPASPYMSYLVDNMVFANTSNVPTEGEKVYNSYLDRYNDGVLDAENTVFWNFDEDVTLAKGDSVLCDTTSADVNVKRENTTGPYVDIANGTLNFGINNTIEMSGTKGDYSTAAYLVDKTVPLSAAVGKTYVIEYDFTYNGNVWDTDAQDVSHTFMRSDIIVSDGNTKTLFTGYRVNDGDGVGTKLTFEVGGKQDMVFAKGVSYKLRFEIAVTADNAATVSVYVDNALYNTFAIERSGITALKGLRFRLGLCANQDYAIDNFLATVIDTPAAE